VPFATVERVLLLHAHRYSGSDPRTFQKLLRSRHGIELRCPLFTQILRGAGLLVKAGDLQDIPAGAQTGSRNSRFS